MHLTRFIFTVLVLSGLISCSSTKLQDYWQSENFSRSDLNNVLVVGVTSNQTNRFLFENEIARKMTDSGLNGVTSHTVMGDALPTKEEVEAYVKSHNIDYILATKLEDIKVEKDYVPASVRNYYTGPYYSSYGGYYGGYGYGNTVTMTREAYIDTRTLTTLVTTIFEVKSGEPVWVGRSETFEAGSISYLADDIASSTWRHIAK